MKKHDVIAKRTPEVEAEIGKTQRWRAFVRALVEEFPDYIAKSVADALSASSPKAAEILFKHATDMLYEERSRAGVPEAEITAEMVTRVKRVQLAAERYAKHWYRRGAGPQR